MKAISNSILFLSSLLLVITPTSGQTWTQTSANTNYEWGSVACSADGTKLAASTIGGGTEGIFLSTNSGATWAICSGPDNANSLVSSADGTKLAATDTADNKIYTSIDSGGTWSEARPTSGWRGEISVGGVAMSTDGKTLMVLTDQSGGGGIYVSTNTGSNWILATNIDTSWENAVCSANGTKLAALMSSLENSVYVSTNSGGTWQKTLSFQTPEPGESWMVSTCDANRLLAEGVGSGADKFYLSTNWGETWSGASP